MKKNIRRLLALALTLALMFSLAVVASAASKTITFEGGRYIVNASKGTLTEKGIQIENALRFQHTYGNVTPVLDPRDYSVTYSASVTSDFSSHILSLLPSLGLKQSHTESGETGNIFYYAEVYDATGTYCLGVVFEGYTVPWSVLLDMPSTTGATYPDEFGTISCAPTGNCWIEPVKVG